MVKLIENQVISHKEFEMIKITDEVRKAEMCIRDRCFTAVF